MTPEEILAFINSPDTVDFIVRRNEYFDRLMNASPVVIVTQTLAGRYAVCYTRASDFPEITRIVGTGMVSSAATVLGPLENRDLTYSGITGVQSDALLDLRGSGVIIGIIDTGIDYTSPAFIREDGTSKIAYIYDQTVSSGPAPEGFFFGREYTRAEINSALSSSEPFSVVPEQDESGHGTFIASVAAGQQTDDFTGAAPDSEIIAVKLRKAKPFYLESYFVPPEQEDAFGSVDVMIGIEYVLERARILGRPCVICLGLGGNFGSHDGFSIFEEYLAGVSNLRGVCECIAAGNEARARHHAQGQIAAEGESTSLDIRVGSGGSNIYLSIWSGVGDRISAAVRSPTGEFISKVAARPNLTFTSPLVLEKATVGIGYYFPVEGLGGQLTVVRIENATAGVWSIILYGDIVLDGSFDAWLPITGFISPDIDFLLPSPFGTVTVPATLSTSIAVGASDSATGALYQDSSWGPNRNDLHVPTLVAPGVNVQGYFPGGLGSLSGTSAACAITSGAAALMLQWGVVNGNDVALSTYQIRAYMIRGCRRNDSLEYPNERWGYGELDLLRSFRLMRNL